MTAASQTRTVASATRAAGGGSSAGPPASLPYSMAGPYNPWLIAMVVSLATFMEVLDTSIANVALRNIAGGPSTSLAELIFFRVLQGIGGGGLQPSNQSILRDTFPPGKLGAAFSLFSMVTIVAPAIGPVLNKVQARWLVATGLLLEGAATHHMCGLDTNASFEAIAWARVWQSAPLPLLIVPINTVAYVGVPEERSADASAMLNFFRNLGGSFGVSFGTTWVTRRSQFHQNNLVSNLTPFDATYRDGLANIRRGLIATGASAADASNQAMGTLYAMVQKQAAMMSYLDVFFVLAVASAALAPLGLLLRDQEPDAPPAGG